MPAALPTDLFITIEVIIHDNSDNIDNVGSVCSNSHGQEASRNLCSATTPEIELLIETEIELSTETRETNNQAPQFFALHVIFLSTPST